MSNGQILQLATLPMRQTRVGTALLKAHAIAAVIRLSIDPTQTPVGSLSREVTISWVCKSGKVPAAMVQREIGWDLIPKLADDCTTFPLTWNEYDLTEMAAIAVTAMLVENLEGGVLQSVLPIGSGGDYLVLTRRAKKPDQIEISGIREDDNGSRSRTRVSEKAGQVLTHCKCGFVSVTTFSHPPGATVQSCLHFVRRGKRKRKRRR